MEAVFDKNPGHRSDGEWRQLLDGLVQSLTAHTGIRFAPTSWFIDDHPGYAHACGCVDICGPVSPALQLEARGVLCISVNHSEVAWVSADILLFSGGRRVLGPDSYEVVRFQYTPYGWVDHGWVCGECGEWESKTYPTDARWRHADVEKVPGLVSSELMANAECQAKEKA